MRKYLLCPVAFLKGKLAPRLYTTSKKQSQAISRAWKHIKNPFHLPSSRRLSRFPRERSAKDSGRAVVKALKKISYEQDRQRGSHIILRQTNSPHRRVRVPDHKEVVKGTLRAIIREVGLTVDEFNDLL